jgi:hypothetical protein
VATGRLRLSSVSPPFALEQVILPPYSPLSNWPRKKRGLLFAIGAARPCFIYTVKEHERVGAIRVDPQLVGSEGDSLVGSFKCAGEFATEDVVVS